MSGSEHQHEANLNTLYPRGLTSVFHDSSTSTLRVIALVDVGILSLTFYMQRASKTFGVIIDHVIPRDLQSLPYLTLNKHGLPRQGPGTQTTLQHR